MLTHETLESFLVHSGYIEPSLVEMRPKNNRVIRGMDKQGHDSLDNDMAVTELLLILQQMRRPEARDAAAEHHLRNMTGVREGGRWK